MITIIIIIILYIIDINKDFSSTNGKWRQAQTASKKFVYNMICDLLLLLLLLLVVVVVVLLPACLPWITMEWLSCNPNFLDPIATEPKEDLVQS
jgi:Na+/H+ antiporter NhaC